MIYWRGFDRHYLNWRAGHEDMNGIKSSSFISQNDIHLK